MYTLLLVTLLSGTPSTSDTSATLLGQDKAWLQASLETTNQRLSVLKSEKGAGVAFGFGVGLAAAAVVYPVVSLLLAALGGWVGVVRESFGIVFGRGLAIFFGAIPVWGWILMGAAVVAGVALMVGAVISDAPRKAEFERLPQRRRAVMLELQRSPVPVKQPPTTLLTF